MTPWIKRNDRGNKPGIRIFDEPYLVINIFFTGVIVLIIAYSCFFSPEKDNYPVQCIHEKITGKPCPSCGLSHSFSLILRGRIDEAYDWNGKGMTVFIFFVSQLIMRILFSWIFIRHQSVRKQLMMFDIIGSSVLFLITFTPFIVYILRF